jgi:hypothetical protein
MPVLSEWVIRIPTNTTLAIVIFMEKDEKTRSSNQLVFSFAKYLSGFFLIICGILILTALILFFKFLDDIISFFYLFEISFPEKLIFSLIRNVSITDIAIIFVAFSAFFYMMQSISDKGYMINDSEEVEVKYYKSLNLLLAILNYTILIPLLLFLIFIIHMTLEAGILLTFYLISVFIAVPSFKKFSQVIMDYSQLSQLSPIVFKKRYESIFKQMESASWLSILWHKDGRKELSLFIRNGLHDKEGRKKLFEFFVNGLILYIIIKRDYGYKALIVLLFLLPFIEFYFAFNLLSILYIELTLLFWYFIFCAISILPKGPVTLNIMGKDIKFAYIIEDSDKGYISVISANESPKRISKSQVRYLESSKIIIPVGSLPKPMKARTNRNIFQKGGKR